MIIQFDLKKFNQPSDIESLDSKNLSSSPRLLIYISE